MSLILECTCCRKRTSAIEAEDRKFYEGKCACGGDLLSPEDIKADTYCACGLRALVTKPHMSQKQNKTTSSEDELQKFHPEYCRANFSSGRLPARSCNCGFEYAIHHRDKLIEARARWDALEAIYYPDKRPEQYNPLDNIFQAINKEKAEIKRLEGEGE